MRNSGLVAILFSVITSTVLADMDNTNTVSVAGDSHSPATYRVHQVEIVDFQFRPQILTVREGDTVVFTNLDVVPHTVTEQNELWDSDMLVTGQSWSVVVNRSRAGNYFCKYHPGMKATFSF